MVLNKPIMPPVDDLQQSLVSTSETEKQTLPSIGKTTMLEP